MARPAEIRSGGQTGVDRAALDVALELGIPIAGWVPIGRLAEDGRISDRYAGLRETTSSDAAVRTEWNVRDADATLIIHFGPLAGGTRFTRDVAVRMGKQHLLLDLDAMDVPGAERAARGWLEGLPSGITLNVAGPRASQAPAGYQRAVALLRALFRDVAPAG